MEGVADDAPYIHACIHTCIYLSTYLRTCLPAYLNTKPRMLNSKASSRTWRVLPTPSRTPRRYPLSLSLSLSLSHRVATQRLLARRGHPTQALTLIVWPHSDRWCIVWPHSNRWCGATPSWLCWCCGTLEQDVEGVADAVEAAPKVPSLSLSFSISLSSCGHTASSC